MDLELAKSKLLANRNITEVGCWEWTGYLSEYFYGSMNIKGRNYFTHRISYTIHKGEIPKGNIVCHSCDNPRCFNPDHLWAGTRLENMRDSKEKGRNGRLNRTHCLRGHDYAVYGRYRSDGTRGCNMCDLGKNRVKTGWPKDLAYSMPPGQLGYRPPEAGPVAIREPNPRSTTHCKRGHEFTPENTYVYPSNGRRECRRCKYNTHRNMAPNAPSSQLVEDDAQKTT